MQTIKFSLSWSIFIDFTNFNREDFIGLQLRREGVRDLLLGMFLAICSLSWKFGRVGSFDEHCRVLALWEGWCVDIAISPMLVDFWIVLSF